MRCTPYIKETKREWIRQKRREIRAVRKLLSKLRSGSAIRAIYGTRDFCKAVETMNEALNRMDEITKPLR